MIGVVDTEPGGASNKSHPEEKVDGDDSTGVDAAVAAPGDDTDALGDVPDESRSGLGEC